jgi:dihydroorotate dehydrogenase (fumarate)
MTIKNLEVPFMDLSIKYLGFNLPHPFMSGASPLADTLDSVKRVEDAGASAIVMRSLFEEQIKSEELATNESMMKPAESFAEALSYFPDPEEFKLGPDEYLEQVRRIKGAVSIPVIASLNGTTPGGWLNYARLIQDAGADALELNVYMLATDPEVAGADIEQQTVEMVREVKKAVKIPVAVKLSPFYSSTANMARRLDEAGADALVIFNRFYQPDINIDDLEVDTSLTLSDSGELLLRLRWLAILSGRIQADLAVTGGVHSGTDAIKAIMCGAHGVQLVSALLHKGPGHLETIRNEVAAWLEEKEYESLEQMHGSMSLLKSPDPSAFERANYAHILQSWEGAVS